MTDMVYDHLCSIGELIDKLSIENIKCSYANHEILELRKSDAPDHFRISLLEFKARSSGEQRVRLKNEINKRLAEAIKRGSIESSPEARTYEIG